MKVILREQKGSLTVESVFVFSLLIMILGGSILFSFSLHDRVLGNAATLTAGLKIRYGTEAGAAGSGDLPGIRADYYRETGGNYLIYEPEGLDTELSGDRVLVRSGAASRVGGQSRFSWLRSVSRSDCSIELGRLPDPVRILLKKHAERIKEGGF